MTSTATTQSGSFLEAGKLFHETRARISGPSVAERLWKRHLHRHQQQRLGETFHDALETHRSAVGMWQFLHPVSYQRAVIEVGEVVGFLRERDRDFLLREAGELPQDPEEAKQQAIERGDLVLERFPPCAYWNGELIDVDWATHGAAWQFLVLTCEHELRGQQIDRWSFGDAARENIVTQEKSRLKSTPGFPSGLIDFFEVVGQGTQRFAFPRDRILLS